MPELRVTILYGMALVLALTSCPLASQENPRHGISFGINWASIRGGDFIEEGNELRAFGRLGAHAGLCYDLPGQGLVKIYANLALSLKGSNWDKRYFDFLDEGDFIVYDILYLELSAH